MFCGICIRKGGKITKRTKGRQGEKNIYAVEDTSSKRGRERNS